MEGVESLHTDYTTVLVILSLSLLAFSLLAFSRCLSGVLPDESSSVCMSIGLSHEHVVLRLTMS